MSAKKTDNKKNDLNSEKKSKVKKKPAPKKSKKGTVSKDVILIEKLANELKSFEDKHIRLKAEFDNFRRRKEKDFLKLLEYDGEDIILSLLSVIDDFERLLDAFGKQKKGDLDSISHGLQMINDKLIKILKEKRVESFGEPGELLDADLHDAMMVQEDPKKEDNEILTIYEKGYRYKDKVLRHAKVIVNKK